MSKTCFSIVLGLFIVFASNSAASAVKLKKGIIYDKDAQHKKVLYVLDRNVVQQKNRRYVSDFFKTPKGKNIAIENFVYHGGKLKSYRLRQNQIGIDAKANLTDKKINFTLSKKQKDGSVEVSRNQEAYQPNVISKNQMVPYLWKQWHKLMKDETVKIRLLVLSRAETVGFKFFKEKEVTYQGKQAVVLKMKPSSFIIAALVDPLYLTFEKEGEHKLLSVNGRVLPKKQVEGEWEDLDAVTQYEYF